jgi:hypothetical protein
VSNQNGLEQRPWSYCNVLRDDGSRTATYLEQLTYLLFLRWPTSSGRAAVVVPDNSSARAARARRCAVG